MTKRLSIIKKAISLLTACIMFMSIISFTNNQVEAYQTLIKGIDVSTHQGDINWKSVANSGIQFAIIRCGSTNVANANYGTDSKFATNYQGATQAGIKVGTYMYTSANSKAEMKSNVESMLQTISGKKFTYPVYLDVEQASRQQSLGKTTLTDIVLYGLGLIRDAGYQAGVYANQDWFNNYIDRTKIVNAGYEIWLARYPSGEYAVNPSGYDYSSTCSVWQYSSKGSVSGISGNVDVDVSYKNPQENILSGMSITGQTVPDVIHPSGKAFYMKGIITSILNITKVWGGVYNRDGSATSEYAEASPNSTTYNLATYFDYQVIFDHLSDGYYTYKIQARDSSGKEYTLINSDFQIGNPPVATSLTEPIITTDKEIYEIGETVNISWKASPTNSNISHYWLQIFAPDGSMLLNDTMYLNTSYSYKTSQSGKYRIVTFATPIGSIEGEGSITSEKTIIVTVKPTNAKLSISKNEFTEGEEIVFTPSATNANGYTIGIDDEFGNRKVTEPISVGATYSISSLEPGIYSAYVTAINDVGYNDSARILFSIKAIPEYTITLNPNGGTVYGSAAATQLSPNIKPNSSNWYMVEVPTRKGYTFTGFYTASQGGTKVYGADGKCTDSEYFKNNQYIATNNLTVYAQWKPIKSIISFDANGGITNTESKEVAYGNQYGELPLAKREGYVFDGWFLDINYKMSIASNDIVKVTSDTTVYAKWFVKGDVNSDGKLNIADAVMLQRCIIAKSDVELTEWRAADIFEDECIDIFDFCILRNLLLERNGERL